MGKPEEALTDWVEWKVMGTLTILALFPDPFHKSPFPN